MSLQLIEVGKRLLEYPLYNSGAAGIDITKLSKRTEKIEYPDIQFGVPSSVPGTSVQLAE